MLLYVYGKVVQVNGYEAYEEDFKRVAKPECANAAEAAFANWLEAYDGFGTGFSVILFAEDTKGMQRIEFWFHIQIEDGDTWYVYGGMNAEGETEKRQDFEVVGLDGYIQDFKRFASDQLQNVAESRLMWLLDTIKAQKSDVDWAYPELRSRESADGGNYVFYFDVGEETDGKTVLRYRGVEEL